MRAVLDPSVLISGLLSSRGAAAQVLREVRSGAFELVVSDLLLDELRRALAYPKLRRRISAHEAAIAVRWLESAGTIEADPQSLPTVRSADPDDDYLIALAAAHRCVLVSGDRHLLDLAERIPVVSAPDFLALLADLP